jgi:hypothetical protein
MIFLSFCSASHALSRLSRLRFNSGQASSRICSKKHISKPFHPQRSFFSGLCPYQEKRDKRGEKLKEFIAVYGITTLNVAGPMAGKPFLVRGSGFVITSTLLTSGSHPDQPGQIAALLGSCPD